MTRGLVSVIIPTYNRADYVVEAIRSAQAQTYPRTQIIVVDDGSCDDTARRVAEMSDVEYCYQGHGGQGTARNHGLRIARGEYVGSLDSDDLWDADFLSRSVACLEEFALDFVFTNWVKVRGDQTLPSEWLRDGKWKPYRTDRRGEWWLLTLLLRRNSIVSGWGEHMQIADDWYLILEMVLRRPCKTAFSLTPRWRKRTDGRNIYDGRPFAEAAKKLHLHDYPTFRRDFRALLSRRERLTLTGREAGYRLRLLLHQTSKTDIAERLKIPAVITRLRSPEKMFIGYPAGAGRGIAGDD